MKIVIGGGIVGLSSALALARAGHDVVAYAPRDEAAPSWGNAGHLAVEQIEPLASRASLRSAPRRLFAVGGALDFPLSMARHWLPFALDFVKATKPQRFAAGRSALGGLMKDAVPAWRRLTESLDAPDILSDGGHLVVWESAASAEAGRRAWQAIDIGTATVKPASPDIKAKLAALTGKALHEPTQFMGSGQIRDLGHLHELLRDAVSEAGVDVRDQRADLTLRAGKAVVEGVAANAVLVAAGVGSRPLMERAGHPTPLIAERGYHIRARADAWPADLPPVVFEDRSMIVTRYADCVQAASFVELGSPTAPPDPRKWRRLERHVAELGLPMRPPYRRWMGCRPTLPDYLPAIGRSRRAHNLFYAFGHQHLGLTLAPLTAEIVAAMIGGDTLPVDIAPFDINRFAK
ncbi:NAD(P)/FAD-dependent oxidoreductase [Stakelama saccharophila]|uniref:FAD-binding oxidoreductase n=1 Tax=Stakelama saccharophila TaxID=3075605 RepID=A0ABZ0B7K5_9SPHN|nr:FAD-binding oxidoreductase [Stakelama sp. W311]WNO53405.1 FAD-binding oxidoreductase [Stakelama sp. W311]